MLVLRSTACSSCLLTNLSYQLLCGRLHWMFWAKKEMFDIIYVAVMRFLSSRVADSHRAAIGAGLRERKPDQSFQ